MPRLGISELSVLVAAAAIVWIGLVPRRAFEISAAHCTGRCRRLLRPGWFAGLPRDASDDQLRPFREQLPLLLVLAAAHIVSGRVTRRRLASDLAFAAAALFFLHGPGALLVLALATANFALARAFSGRGGVAAAWAFALAVLLAKEFARGPADAAVRAVAPWRPLMAWWAPCNLLVLRMLSFAIDAHRARTAAALSWRDGYAEYLSYVLYLPLYLAGPIVSFESFVAQRRAATAAAKAADSPLRAGYVARLLAAAVLLDALSHRFHGFALARSGAYRSFGAADACVFGYWLLLLVYLKFFVIWRGFRLWAALDGVDAPENLPSCISVHHSLASFWRSWHASFNQWLVRYLYVPLGGRAARWRNLALCFAFVALWHDATLKLLLWGALLPAAFAPELAATAAAARYPARWSHPGYRHLVALGGAATIGVLVAANLVGFGVDAPGGAGVAMRLVATSEGAAVLGAALVTMFIGVHLQLELRESSDS